MYIFEDEIKSHYHVFHIHEHIIFTRFVGLKGCIIRPLPHLIKLTFVILVIVTKKKNSSIFCY